jgi:ATP-dependent DNA helicase RecQ
VGADISRADWFRYMRELVTLGYLAVTDDEYPVLKLTDKSEAVLKGLQKVELIASQTIEEKQQEVIPYEAGLLNELKLTRRDIALNENVPAYIILSDAALMEMATYLPQTLEELHLISGFGDVKLARYGRELLIPVKNYCTKHNLASRIKQKSPKRERKSKRERPVTARRGNDTRVETFTLYRSGKSVTDIAAERGLSPITIESHLSYFVQTGEIDILELVKQEKIPAIQDAVESYGHDRLAPLKEVLGEDYSYGEIKAVIGWMNRGNN